MAPESAAGAAARIDAVGLPDAAIGPLRDALAAAGVRPDPQARATIVAFGTTGPGLAEALRAAAVRGHVIALGKPDPADCWDLLRAGASDVLTWDDTGEVAGHVAERLRRWETVDALLDCPHVKDFLVGESASWRSVLRDAVEAARFTSSAVLITGESGTGKERLAQLIHDLDPRPNKKKLVILDCSTVVPSLSGSEFFGHEKGAFTGAMVARAGSFELADGGTLFLDEVGELPVATQAELLRVIQEGTFKRVGSSAWRTSSFRLICATNRDLAAERRAGAFRSDFYYRIAGCRLHLPSLAERPDDVVPLVRHFFRQAQPDAEPPELSAAVRDLLVRREYRGNVRDLRSLALRIIHRHLGAGPITVGDVPNHDRPGDDPAGDPDQRLADYVRGRMAEGAALDDIVAAVRETAARVAGP
ncbi:sigma 54-interacting transcriptional regulator [Paractinoplanes globisporus]|uniref:Sigma 54-interacting transcriptional regulator n=1 Tax=Paractinoplanes globisporus TaxID=113565 RepID=A0ABW6WMV0_9ACTN|nr:sigma 54-interacting transcriptional regulator [Actinoplanes globisporus]